MTTWPQNLRTLQCLQDKFEMSQPGIQAPSKLDSTQPLITNILISTNQSGSSKFPNKACLFLVPCLRSCCTPESNICFAPFCLFKLYTLLSNFSSIPRFLDHQCYVTVYNNYFDIVFEMRPGAPLHLYWKHLVPSIEKNMNE